MAFDETEPYRDENGNQWFLLTALLMDANNQPTTLAGILEAPHINEARRLFFEGTLQSYGHLGMAIRQISCSPIKGLKIERLPPPPETQATSLQAGEETP